MDQEQFRDRFWRDDELTAAQRKEWAAVLSGPVRGKKGFRFVDPLGRTMAETQSSTTTPTKPQRITKQTREQRG